ncbi:hypothetical protein PMAYCL1PPCAC_06043, partial [Pristionchus mayeri]
PFLSPRCLSLFQLRRRSIDTARSYSMRDEDDVVPRPGIVKAGIQAAQGNGVNHNNNHKSPSSWRRQPLQNGNVRSKTLSYARSIVASIEEEHDSLYTSMDEEESLPETPKKTISVPRLRVSVGPMPNRVPVVPPAPDYSSFPSSKQQPRPLQQQQRQLQQPIVSSQQEVQQPSNGLQHSQQRQQLLQRDHVQMRQQQVQEQLSAMQQAQQQRQLQQSVDEKAHDLQQRSQQRPQQSIHQQQKPNSLQANGMQQQQ